MTTRRSILALAAAAAFAGTAAQADAALTVVAGGTSAPATTLGPYAMTPFGPDGVNPVDTNTLSIPTPLGTPVALSSVLRHTTVGDELATWSNGYAGDVYYTAVSSATPAGLVPAVGSDPAVRLAMPAGVGAFYLYVQPFRNQTYAMTVTADDATTVTQQVSGSGGASYYGFFAGPGQSITGLTVDSGDPVGFAIGEFGIAATTSVPEPTSAAVVGLAAAGLVGRRRGPTKLSLHRPTA